ncbi:MAG: hypothetical protein KAR13_17580 [Desulfobulbaceae bacterium]|nr:hypothetical protein [Desulfobulbaceae bacterium]
MANQKYQIKGKLTSTLAGTDLSTLTVVAYKFLGPSSMQTFAKASVDASGEFILDFEYGPAGSTAINIDIMPIPNVIETFGVFNIERSIPGLFFPRIHIDPGDWSSSAGTYTASVTLAIPNHIWGRWDWLSEEFTVIGRVVKREEEALLPIPFAWVSAADADLPRPYGSGVGGAQTDEWGNFTIIFSRINFFLDYARHLPFLRRYGIEQWPDLIFHVTQKIGGVKQRIYSETEHDARPKTMWDEPHRMLYITLITEEGITNDETYPPIPAGENFLFHGIGVIDPHSITDGYATTGPDDDLPNRKDCPFGSKLHIKGQFDTTGPNPPRYYQMLYAKWTGPAAPDPGDFQPIANETWTVSQFDASTLDWIPLVIAPLEGVVPAEKVYDIPDYTDISRNKKTRLIAWSTARRDTGISRYPNGKYDLLIKAWDASGTLVSLNPAHPEHNRLTVVLDNNRPKALLKRLGSHDILRTDEMYPYTPVCPVFSKATLATLPVEFEATDAENHFLDYQLFLVTGHNIYMDSARKAYVGKAGALETFLKYQRHMVKPPPWPPPVGSENKVTGGFPAEIFNWNVGHPDVVPCAYQVRLRVRDRTINGYGYIHHGEDTMHFSIAP